jgi:transposase
MNTAAVTDPNDCEALRSRVRELESLLRLSEARCAKLEYKLQDLLRRVFGAKKEKLNPAQRVLFGLPEADELSAASPAATTRALSTGAPRKKRGGRRPKPEHLPIVREVIDLPEAQRAGLVKIREEITEQIEYRPSLFFRRQIVRPVYVSVHRAHAPLIASLPAQIIPQAGVGPGFITHVLVAKYLDHIPLYRQERIDARGVDHTPSALPIRGSRRASADHDPSIHQQLKRKILDSGYIQVDETFTKLIDPERRGRSHDAYFWGYHAPHSQAIVLEFSASRRSEILHEFFPPAWCGQVQTDGASMYPSVFKHRPNIEHFECIAHLGIEAVYRRPRTSIPAREAKIYPYLL